MARSRLSEYGFDDHWRAVLLITVALAMLALATVTTLVAARYVDRLEPIP